MTRTIFLLICWITFQFVPIIEAKEKRFVIDNSYFETFTARNPFKSQLPKEEKKTEQRPEVKPVPPEPKPVPAPPPPQPPMPVIVNPPPVVPPQPPPPRAEPMPILTITGLIWNTDRPQAIVNGQVADVGDIIAGVKIINIRKGGIDVSFQGRTVTLQP